MYFNAMLLYTWHKCFSDVTANVTLMVWYRILTTNQWKMLLALAATVQQVYFFTTWIGFAVFFCFGLLTVRIFMIRFYFLILCMSIVLFAKNIMAILLIERHRRQQSISNRLGAFKGIFVVVHTYIYLYIYIMLMYIKCSLSFVLNKYKCAKIN